MNPSMLNEDDRRQRRRIWLSGTAALLAVAAAGVVWAVRQVPGDIAGRTLAALQAAGLDPRSTVTVEGRSVILSGEAPDAYTRARMRAIAGSIRGVREVSDQLILAPLLTPARPPAAPAPPATDTEPSLATVREAPPAIRSEAIRVAPPDPPPDAAAAEARPAVSASPAPSDAALGQAPSDQPSATPERPPVPPEPEPAPAPPSRLQLPLLHFAFGSTRLTPESELQLMEIVEVLRNRPEVRIELAGHADSVGSKSLNQRLSLQRARTVADRLVAAGIDGARLQTSGCSDSRPLMDNHTRTGRAMNRRVELILIQ